MDALGAEQFTPTGMAAQFLPTGMADYELETVGPSRLMFKMLATGAVTFTQCLFQKWRQYKHQSQVEKERERQQQQQQQQLIQRFEATMALVIQGTPGNITGTPDATTSLGYNYSLLDEQDVAEQQFPSIIGRVACVTVTGP